MRVRKVGVAALASALALGGMIAGSVGVASAKKPVLQGTLSCLSGGTTTISPGLVFAKSNLAPPKFKDKKPKYTTNGTGSACTGSTVSGTQPTGFMLTSKAKGNSRLIVNPSADCNLPGRAAKTKITFNTGDKSKVTTVSETSNYAFTPTGPNTGTSVQFPPCGSDGATALAFAGAHAGDRIETRSKGQITGKAYAGKWFHSRSVTTQTLGQELSDSQDADGVTSLSGDAPHSSVMITASSVSPF